MVISDPSKEKKMCGKFSICYAEPEVGNIHNSLRAERATDRVSQIH